MTTKLKGIVGMLDERAQASRRYRQMHMMSPSEVATLKLSRRDINAICYMMLGYMEKMKKDDKYWDVGYVYDNFVDAANGIDCYARLDEQIRERKAARDAKRSKPQNGDQTIAP